MPERVSRRAASSAPVLVTGATGNVGRAVVGELLARGVPVRVAATDAARARRRLGDAPEFFSCDFTRPDGFAAALDGARGLFLLRPPAISKVRDTLLPVVDRAIRAGAEQIVFVSVAGAERNRFIPHRPVEEHLVAHCPAYTVLRPGFFAQNLGDAYRDDVRERDRIYVPAGRGRAAFVDVRDVAEIAARAFVDPDTHRRRAWTLTGPEALSFDDVAAVLSRELGRPIRYRPASIPGYLRHLRRGGAPWGHAAVVTILHVLFRFGQGSAVDPTLAELLGRPPRTLREYVRDHRELWVP